MSHFEYEEYEGCICVAETDEACLVMIPVMVNREPCSKYRGTGKVWIPKSQIHDDSEVYKRDEEEGRLLVSQWFAENNLE